MGCFKRTSDVIIRYNMFHYIPRISTCHTSYTISPFTVTITKKNSHISYMSAQKHCLDIPLLYTTIFVGELPLFMAQVDPRRAKPGGLSMIKMSKGPHSTWHQGSRSHLKTVGMGFYRDFMGISQETTGFIMVCRVLKSWGAPKSPWINLCPSMTWVIWGTHMTQEQTVFGMCLPLIYVASLLVVCLVGQICLCRFFVFDSTSTLFIH